MPSPPPLHPHSRLLALILDAVDPRLREGLALALDAAPDTASRLALRPDRQIVLVGHRAAGKTRLLPMVAELTGRPALDLDRELEARFQRSLRDWVREDEPSFRAAERFCFLSLPPGAVVAVGGGFLSLHGALLTGHVPLLVPVTFETYRERLLADASRPRLRPALSQEEEIFQVFHEREALHAKESTVSLAEFLHAFISGSR